MVRCAGSCWARAGAGCLGIALCVLSSEPNTGWVEALGNRFVRPQSPGLHPGCCAYQQASRASNNCEKARGSKQLHEHWDDGNKLQVIEATSSDVDRNTDKEYGNILHSDGNGTPIFVICSAILHGEALTHGALLNRTEGPPFPPFSLLLYLPLNLATSLPSAIRPLNKAWTNECQCRPPDQCIGSKAGEEGVLHAPKDIKKGLSQL